MRNNIVYEAVRCAVTSIIRCSACLTSTQLGGTRLENLTLDLDKFTEVELVEIFASTWFGMDLDFKGYKHLDEGKRQADSSSFASLNGIRYSVLSKIAKRFKGEDKYDDMQEILDSAGEIMLVVRGGTT